MVNKEHTTKEWPTASSNWRKHARAAADGQARAADAHPLVGLQPRWQRAHRSEWCCRLVQHWSKQPQTTHAFRPDRRHPSPPTASCTHSRPHRATRAASASALLLWNRRRTRSPTPVLRPRPRCIRRSRRGGTARTTTLWTLGMVCPHRWVGSVPLMALRCQTRRQEIPQGRVGAQNQNL